jgi:hypothetical protein
LRRRVPEHTHTSIPLPLFVFGFLAAVTLNSLVTLPAEAMDIISQTDTFLLTMVMVAFGLETRIAGTHEHGWIAKPLLAGIAGFIFATGTGYALVRNGVGSLDELLVSNLRPAELTVKATANPAAALGAQIFEEIGCVKCHIPSLPGENRLVYIYSDLLLHDMGPALDDKLVQGDASGRDWRTTPLRGIGLRARYLHDGRATSLRDAIIAHGGEAEIIRQRFMDLNASDRQALYVYLNSL